MSSLLISFYAPNISDIVTQIHNRETYFQNLYSQGFRDTSKALKYWNLEHKINQLTNSPLVERKQDHFQILGDQFLKDTIIRLQLVVEKINKYLETMNQENLKYENPISTQFYMSYLEEMDRRQHDLEEKQIEDTLHEFRKQQKLKQNELELNVYKQQMNLLLEEAKRNL